MNGGHEPISDDELIYRRVPLSKEWYNPATTELNSEAFAPSKQRDLTGISVTRAKYNHVERAALGQPGKSYFVAVLRASDIRSLGLKVEPRPVATDLGHSELPDLNAANYKEDATQERKRALAAICLRVEGPFQTPSA